MPCDSGPRGSSDYAEHYLHDGKTAELLCSVLQIAEKDGSLKKFSVQVKAWWADHKERDRKRIAEEMRWAKEESDKKAALAKLTPYERKLIGK